MPLASTPASALAQTIAQKQRTSKIFDDGAPLRRPSACGADQQTQLFARYLRAQGARSPSVSRVNRSSSSLASQPHARIQQNYMRETSSSRRRSRNAYAGEIEQAQIPPPQVVPTNYPSVTRLRSQSPYRSANHSVGGSSTSSITSRVPRCQFPPLPRGRLPSASRGRQVEQQEALHHNSGSQLRQSGTMTGLTHPCQVKRTHMTSLPQQRPQQKLSSSWTIRDPLRSADNTQADFAEAEDGTLQLDASDQQELSQLTECFERRGLHPYGENHHGIASGFMRLPSASACTTANAVQHTGVGATRRLPEPCGTGYLPTFPPISDSLPPGHSTGEQQRQGALIQSSHAGEQQQQLRHLSVSSSQQPEASKGIGAFGMLKAVAGRTSAGNDMTPGVAPSAFGECVAPAGTTRSAGLWQLLDLVCWCAQFAFVLIVCTCRFLNTSYDSWSTHHFKESFSAVLSRRPPLGGRPRGSSAGSCLEGNGARTSLTSQAMLQSSTAASLGRRSQGQNQFNQQQQRHSHQQHVIQRSANTRSSSGTSPLTDANPADSKAWASIVSGNTIEGKAFRLGPPLLKVVALAGAVLYTFCWLLNSVPRDEFIDFDFM